MLTLIHETGSIKDLEKLADELTRLNKTKSKSNKNDFTQSPEYQNYLNQVNDLIISQPNNQQ